MKLNITAILLLTVCSLTTVNAKAADKQSPNTRSNANSTCTGAYPSYFQDPAFTKTGMWDNQVTINQAYPGWEGPILASVMLIRVLNQIALHLGLNSIPSIKI